MYCLFLTDLAKCFRRDRDVAKQLSAVPDIVLDSLSLQVVNDLKSNSKAFYSNQEVNEDNIDVCYRLQEAFDLQSANKQFTAINSLRQINEQDNDRRHYSLPIVRDYCHETTGSTAATYHQTGHGLSRFRISRVTVSKPAAAGQAAVEVEEGAFHNLAYTADHEDHEDRGIDRVQDDIQ